AGEPVPRGGAVPAPAARAAAARPRHNARRRRDPLGEGQPATWRLLLIKVAAEVVLSCRRVVVRLSSSWPYLGHFRAVGAAVAARAWPPPRAGPPGAPPAPRPGGEGGGGAPPPPAARPAPSLPGYSRGRPGPPRCAPAPCMNNPR